MVLAVRQLLLCGKLFWLVLILACVGQCQEGLICVMHSRAEILDTLTRQAVLGQAKTTPSCVANSTCDQTDVILVNISVIPGRPPAQPSTS